MQVLAEYVWLVGDVELRSFTVVLEAPAPSSVATLPITQVDGGKADQYGCKLYLCPRRIFPDPIRGGHHILVLCDVFSQPEVMAKNTPNAWQCSSMI